MRILETVLYAEDLEAARHFYVGLLGLEELSFDAERDLFLKCRDAILILFKASKTVIPDAGIPPHGTVGIGHMAFGVSHSELEEWSLKLAEVGIEVTQDKAWANGARSLYFQDPAGNVLEFATTDLWRLPVD
jgi:catechol 2,3-dioxygenase-like lactoylglutathione lyase family enzyme